MLPQLTVYAKILYLLMVITGVLCDPEHIFLQSTVTNKFIHITKAGKVLADDPPNSIHPQMITVSDHILPTGEMKLTLYIKEERKYICFKKNWRLVTSTKLHNYCYFYETMESGYHRFYSTMDQAKYVGFTRNGRPVRYDGRHPPDERTFNLFKWNETSYYEIAGKHRQQHTSHTKDATRRHHPHTTSTTTTTTTTRRPSTIERRKHNRKKQNMQMLENRQRLFSPKNPADRRHHQNTAADIVPSDSRVTTTETLVLPVHQQLQQMDYVNDERARSEELSASIAAVTKKPILAKKFGKDKPKLRHSHHKWKRKRQQLMAKEEKLRSLDGQ